MSVIKFFLYWNCSLSLFLGKPAVVPPLEIDQMQNHLIGVYNDISNYPKCGADTYHTAGPFSGFSGRVVQTDNSKVKLELTSLGCVSPLKNLRPRLNF